MGFVEIPMVAIPGKNFEIGKYEITQGQWSFIMGKHTFYFDELCGDNCPIIVSMNDLELFLQKLNVKTGKKYRLPTEDEWEYECRGGAQTEYCGSDDVNAVAWYIENSRGDVHPVGQKQPNGYGLYDMSGNVWERVPNIYLAGEKYYVLRGGEYDSFADRVKVTGRAKALATEQIMTNGGFRLARMLP